MPTTRPDEEVPALSSAGPSGERSAKSWVLLWWSFVFALLQSLCTAVIAVSGIRVLIGLSALAAAAGLHVPATGFHSDAIRIPMMLLAFVGALVNLYVIWRVRRLRRRPAAQWRLQPVSPAKLRSERLQIALAVVTLGLLAAEWATHRIIHGVR
jgi:hypothetical protein